MASGTLSFRDPKIGENFNFPKYVFPKLDIFESFIVSQNAADVRTFKEKLFRCKNRPKKEAQKAISKKFFFRKKVWKLK